MFFIGVIDYNIMVVNAGRMGTNRLYNRHCIPCCSCVSQMDNAPKINIMVLGLRKKEYTTVYEIVHSLFLLTHCTHNRFIIHHILETSQIRCYSAKTFNDTLSHAFLHCTFCFLLHNLKKKERKRKLF